MSPRNVFALLATFAISANVAQAQMTVVNGASFDAAGPLAPGSFATMFGQGLCDRTATADWIAPGQLPTVLGGCSIVVNGTAATLDVVDLSTYGIVTRIDAGQTARQGTWIMPLVNSVTPNAAAVGSTFALTITGSTFQGVRDIEFHEVGNSHGGMGMGREDDSNIKVTNVQINSDGTQIAATVHILATATTGTRQIRLETNWGEVTGMMSSSLFTVTNR